MKDDTVVALRQPESFSDDPLTEILRAGARQLLGQAIEAEVAAHIEAHADLTDASGRRRIVRHGHMPEREVQTGIGAVTVKRPRVRDRDPQATGGRIRFTSSILPPYLRRAKSVEALLPWLYLKGISSGDFSEALAALLGPDAPGLTASTIGRLKAVWWDEYEAWQKRDLSARRYVYFWADGVYFSPRMDHDVNGGAKRDHFGGVRRDRLAAGGLVPVVHGRAPRATRRALNRLTRRRAPGGTCGPTGSSVGWVVGSVSSRGLTPAALVEPVAVTVHLEDVDVVGEAIEERACEALGAEHLGPFVEGQIGGDPGSSPARSVG